MFATLVVANLSLILTNRSWSRTMISMFKEPNAALWWVVGGAAVMLTIVLNVPFLQKLFPAFGSGNDETVWNRRFAPDWQKGGPTISIVFCGTRPKRLDASAGDYTGSELTGNCRISWYDWLMRHPLEAPAEAERFHAGTAPMRSGRPQWLASLLAIASEKMDCGKRKPPASSPKPIHPNGHSTP